MDRVVSAGLLMCRLRGEGVEVLLAHPGGPYFASKDLGAWSVPKGIVEAGEDALEAAKRELREELSIDAVAERFVPLGEVRQKGGKVVRAWAFVGDCDPSAIVSDDFELEWPPRSGRKQRFPEVDRAAFFSRAAALERVLPAQRPLIERAFAEATLSALFGDAARGDH